MYICYNNCSVFLSVFLTYLTFQPFNLAVIDQRTRKRKCIVSYSFHRRIILNIKFGEKVFLVKKNPAEIHHNKLKA